MFKVRPERNHTRNSEFSNYLRANYELSVSHWFSDLSLARRRFGYHLPSIDVDSMLFTRTGELLAIFETKRGDEALSRAEHDVILDLANKCQTPAFVLRYWNDNGSWLIKPEPLNGYATEFTNGDAQLDWMGFEDFLSDLGWHWFIPDYHETPMTTSLYFPMIEFDRFKVKSLINFTPPSHLLAQEDTNAPEFKLWTSIGDACEVPALSVVFEPSLGWFKTYPLNHMALKYCSVGQYFSEVEFVDFMYRIHGQPMPMLSDLRAYRPSSNPRRLPPNPANYKVNRGLLLEARNSEAE